MGHIFVPVTKKLSKISGILSKAHRSQFEGVTLAKIVDKMSHKTMI